MLFLLLLVIYAIPVTAISNPTFDQPGSMQSGMKTLISTPIASQTDIITQITFVKSFTTVRTVFGISTIDFIPTTSVDFTVNHHLIISTFFKVKWTITTTFNLLKISYLAWQRPDIVYAQHISPRNGLQSYSFYLSSGTYSQYLNTGVKRIIKHSKTFIQGRDHKLTMNIFINGLKASTLSSQYNLNVTASGWDATSFYFSVSIAPDTRVEQLNLYILTWVHYLFLETIYSYQSSVHFAYNKMEGTLIDNDDTKFIQISGWSGLTMESSYHFKFDFTYSSSTDFYPNQMARLLPYNQFNVMVFSEIGCSTNILDTVTYKCMTTTEMYGCSTYEHIIKMPQNIDLQNVQISPQGKYLIGCKDDRVLVLMYDEINQNYTIFQEIRLLDNCLNLQTNKNWSYFAVAIETRIEVYGLNKTYQLLLEITEGEYTETFSLSGSASFIFAKLNGYYHFYQLNFSRGAYQKFSVLKTTETNLQSYQINEGETIYLRKKNSGKSQILSRQQNRGAYSVVTSDNPEYLFIGMDITADDSIQATFNTDYIIIYNIDNQNERILHQIIPNKHFAPTSFDQMVIRLSNDGLTLALISIMQEYVKKRIIVYQRTNISAYFSETKHIQLPSDYDITLKELSLSEDGSVRGVSYKPGHFILYCCTININNSEVLPNIVYDISQPLLIVEDPQQANTTEDDNNGTIIDQQTENLDDSQEEEGNEYNEDSSQKTEKEPLTIFITIISILNFGMLIGIIIFMLKKFMVPAPQPNNVVYDSHQTNQANKTRPNLDISDHNNSLGDFSQEELKAPKGHDKINRSRKKRKKQQISLNSSEIPDMQFSLNQIQSYQNINNKELRQEN